ncbi:MAG TPA: lasso peptide biosynthesis B2 protein [Thermoanaerobaculia bacterium]|nr:lasso peptide biosynthesis B2 protein [Thermoanaerobaculia bacterium]
MPHFQSKSSFWSRAGRVARGARHFASPRLGGLWILLGDFQGADRRIALLSWILLLRSALLLEVSSKTLIKRALEGTLVDSSRRGDSDRARIIEIFSAVDNRFPVRLSCLPRALALRTLLRFAGWDARLRIGVQKESTEVFSGHAWVEVESVVVLDTTANVAHYHALRYE